MNSSPDTARSRRHGCRYSPLGEGLCGNEVLDAEAELLLCPAHTAAALRHMRELDSRLGTPVLLGWLA